MSNRIRVIRAVLDTNVFLRSLQTFSFPKRKSLIKKKRRGIYSYIRRGNVCDRLVDCFKKGNFVLISSQEILEEVASVLNDSELIKKYRYSSESVQGLLSAIRQNTILTSISLNLHLSRDATDEKFIGCAIAGRAHFLVSEDKDFLDDKELQKALREYGIEIVSALEFYKQIILSMEIV
jgi:putative PIN family toxin of toxin-antitoxin system